MRSVLGMSHEVIDVARSQATVGSAMGCKSCWIFLLSLTVVPGVAATSPRVIFPMVADKSSSLSRFGFLRPGLDDLVILAHTSSGSIGVVGESACGKFCHACAGVIGILPIRRLWWRRT